jgi:hypothetical protein
VHHSTNISVVADSPSIFSLCLCSMMSAVHLQNASAMFPVPSHVDFVHVGGRYRVGKLLGSGRSGESNPDLCSINFLSSLESVYLGRDIRTEVEIAVKIGCADDPSSRLRPEYNVYTEIAGGIGIPPVHWYGKEGQYEVIVMDHLGTSLDDLVSKRQIDQEKIFQYTPQMVCSSGK